MPETFTPITLVNDSGQPLNSNYFNRLETNIETFDDRIAAVEVGTVAAVVLTYNPSLTLDASQGGLFRVIATGNLTLANIANGTNGQEIVLEIQASGADRTLTFAGGTVPGVVITSGQWWAGRFRYNATTDSWLLAATGSGGSSGGGGAPTGAAGGVLSGTYPNPGFAASPTFTGAVTAPRFITPAVVVTYASAITLDAATGSLFRCTATGPLTLTDIINGTNGQEVVLEVLASGADQVLTIGGSATGITAGAWWSGRFRYNAGLTTWVFDDGSATGGSGGGTSLIVQDEGAALTARSTLNFTGANVSVVDDAANARTTVTVLDASATATPGLVPLDSFAGANDDAKLAAAFTYAAAQSYKPTIYLGPGNRTFANTYTTFDGLRLTGTLVGEREFGTTGRGCVANTTGASFLTVAAAGSKNGYITGIQWRSGGTTKNWLTDVADLAAGPLLQDFAFTDIAWVGYHHVMWARHLRCSIDRMYCNAGNDTQFKLGGSDNWYWTQGYSYLSSTLVPANGSYFVYFPHMSQTVVGECYITTENATGVRIDGSYGGMYFRGTKFDSTLRDATNACQGAQLLITGGTGMIFDKCWFFNGMVNVGTTGRSDQGQVHISGGNNILLDGCQWSGDRGNWANFTPNGTPAVYATSAASFVRVSSPTAPGTSPDKILKHAAAGIISCDDASWTISVG